VTIEREAQEARRYGGEIGDQGFVRQSFHWLRYYLLPGLRLSRTKQPLWVVVQAVVVQGDEVLLVKRTTPRAWEIPGGFPEPKEWLLDAVVREVREETGLQVRIERFSGLYLRTGFFAHLSTVFLCAPEGGQLLPSAETLSAEFYPVDQLPRGLFPWQRQVIVDAMNGDTKPVIRRQHLGVRTVTHSLLIALGMQAGFLR